MVCVVHVNLPSDEIVGFLKQELQIKPICEKLLYQRVIQQTSAEYGIEVTPDEIQSEADLQRRNRKLESAADTYAWLNEQLISSDDWEAGIHSHLLQKKLAQHLFQDQVESYFAEHRLDFEQVILYQIVVPYEAVAQELFYQIEEGEISFFQAAHLYDIDEQRRLKCGYEGKLQRWSLEPTMASNIFSAKVGEVIGPLHLHDHYHLLIVEEFIAPDLNREIRQAILDRIFGEWMESELNRFIYQHD
ncbi:MAG: peptidylprolyl isomerase [Merismopedia sp. SIO2A8]|nr:peptidylprolyl isomerase [Merismopedia sp. SIO2A8]